MLSEMPHSVAAGVAWNHNNKWKVGLDYSIELWKNAKFPQLTSKGGENKYVSTTGAFDNSQHVSLGGEYVHNSLGIKYRDHIRYRAGVSYGTTYAKSQRAKRCKRPVGYTRRRTSDCKHNKQSLHAELLGTMGKHKA